MITLDIYRTVNAVDVHPGDTILDPVDELDEAKPFEVRSITRDLDGTVTFGANDGRDSIIVEDGTDTIRVLPTPDELQQLWAGLRQAIKVAVGEWSDRWESDQADDGADPRAAREAMPTPPWTVSETNLDLDVAVTSGRGARRFVVQARSIAHNEA